MSPRSAFVLTFGFLASTLVVGCLATPESYAKRTAKLSCKDQEECHPDEFEMLYGDQKTCREKAEESFNDLAAMQEAAGCEYQAKYARSCIREGRKHVGECKEQTESIEDCSKVWECPQSGELQLDDEDAETLRAEIEEAAPAHRDPWSTAMFGLQPR